VRPVPPYLIWDNDSKFGPAFARVAKDSGIALLGTAYRAPLMNALCERYLGSVRRECPDHRLILGEVHLRRALRAHVTYFNEHRLHQGSAQQIPVPGPPSPAEHAREERVEALPILGGCTTPTAASRDQRPGRGRTTEAASTGVAGASGGRALRAPDPSGARRRVSTGGALRPQRRARHAVLAQRKEEDVLWHQERLHLHTLLAPLPEKRT